MSDQITAAAAPDGDIREQAAQYTLAANPLVGVRGRDILDSAGVLLGRMVANPAVAAKQCLSLLGELGRIVELVLQRNQLMMQIAEAPRAGDGFVEDRAAGHLLDVLAEVADGDFLRHADRALVR